MPDDFFQSHEIVKCPCCGNIIIFHNEGEKVVCDSCDASLSIEWDWDEYIAYIE